MSRRFGFPLLIVAVARIMAGAPQAHANVRFGVTVGPAYPPPPYAHARLYPYPYRNYYAYPPPAYGYSYGYRSGHGERTYWEQRNNEWRGHERRGYGRGRDHWR
jgi:hypothetical protein